MTLARTLLAAMAVSLAASAAMPALAQTATVFNSERPAARVDYWQLRAAEIDRELSTSQSLQPIRIVFVGDSITDFWHLDANPWFPGLFMGRQIWDESFAGTVPSQRAINLGVSGDRIEHVLHRLLPAASGGQGWLDRRDLQPDRIFVMVGINNSFDTEDPATASIYRGVVAVLERIHERKPHAQIVVESLLPTDSAAKNRDLVLPVNAMLQTYAAANRMAYLDLYAAFIDQEGNQRRELFNDGLHPNRDGYRIWRDRVVAFLGSPQS